MLPGRNPNDRHFRTDHLLTNLSGRTLSNGFITVAAQGTKLLLTIVSTMILSRLLTPADFGLVAMVATITGFLAVLKDAGLSTATVQREGITHAQVSNLFWINVAVGCICTLTVAGASPLIAAFYDQPLLRGIAVPLAFTFLFSAASAQHRALLVRQMRFKSLAAIEISSMVVSLVLGAVFAWRGFGYWALVIATVSLELSTLVFTIIASGWRPQLPARNSGTRPLISFGAHLTMGGLIYSLIRGMDTLLLGKWYGPDAAGLYTRAAALLLRPLDQFLSPITSVLVPTLSRLQGEPERYRQTFLPVYCGIALVTLPATGFFVALAKPITLLLLGPQWTEAAVIFSGFAAAMLYSPLAASSIWLLTSQGRGKEMLRSNMILSSLTLVAILGGLPYGPIGVALSFSLSGLLIRLPILYYLVGRNGPIRTVDLWAPFFRVVPLALAVFGASWLARELCSASSLIIQLLGGMIAALVVTSAGVAIIPSQRRLVLHFFDMIQRTVQARRNR